MNHRLKSGRLTARNVFMVSDQEPSAARKLGCLAFLCFLGLGCAPHDVVVESEPFTVIVLPDTQHAINFQRQKAHGFAIDSKEIFIGQMRYVVDRAAANGGDVVFVSSVGDVWQHATESSDPGHLSRGVAPEPGSTHRTVNRDATLNEEIPVAIEGYEMLSEAGIRFGVAPGNHDYDAWWTVAGSSPNRAGRYPAHVGGLDNFRMVFGKDSQFYSDKDWYVGSFRGGANSAQVFSAGGYQFLHLALEMQPGDEVLAWAAQVIAEHPGLPTIVATHDYLSPRGEREFAGMRLTADDPEYHNSSEVVWEQLIRKSDQVFLVVCGHQDGQAMRIDKNDNGHDVYQILANYQDRGQAGLDAGQPTGPNRRIASIGDGWLREMTFHLGNENPKIDVRTYSSHYGKYSSELSTYAEWYKSNEQPGMTDEQYGAAEEFTIDLSDFHARFSASGNRQ